VSAAPADAATPSTARPGVEPASSPPPGPLPAGAAPVLRAQGLRVRRDDVTLVEVGDFALRGGEVHVLLGPNGAGKSTLLQALNGLEPAEGRLTFGDRPVRTRADRLALRRGTAAVFQKPHLLNATVQANAESGLRLRGVDRAEARRRAAEALDLLGVAHLAARRPAGLSGGEAQRVSIARALAVAPAVLFLDEPLASLDPPTRTSLVDDLLRIFARSSMAVVWVTHDRDEALAVGDALTYLEAGRVVQTGPVFEVFARPASRSFAEFLGLDTFLPGRVVGEADGHTRFVLDTGVELACGEAPEGAAVVVVPPEDVVLFSGPPAEHSSSLRNVVQGTVKSVAPSGRLLRVVVRADGLEIAALVTRAGLDDLGLSVGGPVTAAFKAAALHPLPRHERRSSR
jgi:tungstate transport system ATP-binding protein